MLPNWLYGKSKSKLAELLGGGGTPSDYNQVKAQVTQNTEDIALLDQDSVTWDNLSEVGAVNFFNNTIITQIQTETAFTVDPDTKIITVVVDSTTAASRNVSAPITLKAGVYKLSGCPSGAPESIRVTCYSHTDSQNLAIDNGNGAEFTISKTHECRVYIDLRTATPAGTYIFKLMVTPASYNGPYVPYAMTNQELTEKLTADANLNAAVDLSSYNSYSKLYTAPSDGYVHFLSAASGSTARTIYAYGNNTTAATDPHFTHSTSTNNKAFEIFIKKGLKIYANGLQTGDTISFYPLS